MLLENKNAVIYGAAGSVGSTVARAFAREGAKVYLTARDVGALEDLAKELGNADTAADVTHDAFIKAFSAYHRVSPDPETTRTWLITIARNCCIDYRRQDGRWQRLLRRLERVRESPLDVEVLAHHRSELERATAAIVQLRPRERELIGLRVAADLSFREVAALLHISEEAAKVATRRALGKLRSKLENKTIE